MHHKLLILDLQVPYLVLSSEDALQVSNKPKIDFYFSI